MNTIYIRTSREMARDAIIDVVRSVCGTSTTHAFLAKSIHTSIGIAALSDIKSDFVRKARGETGEDGNKWPTLSREFLAYGRRFGPDEQAALKKAAGLNSGHRNRGLLSAAQDKRWRQIFSQSLNRLVASLPLGAAKARAAQIAWTALKRMGAKTKLDVFGDRVHEILRDTGVLLNSLSAGELDTGDGNYTPPADQIFMLTESGIIVGTNVVYARHHNRGSAKMPKREFIPVDGAPQVWLDRWTSVAATGLTHAFRYALESLGGAA